MPELIAKSALEGRSLTLGTVTLAELEVGPITSLAVFPGGAKAVAKGLKTLGLAMPEPNTFTEKKGARIVWTVRCKCGPDSGCTERMSAPAAAKAASL